jgi:fermentation-respiration switch protein FrsA (DUF1100 family)
LPELQGKEPRLREEKVLHAHAASLRARKAFAIAVIGVAALFVFVASAQRAEAKAKGKTTVAKGPKGLKFYKPPKSLPKQHGTLIWARKASGLVALSGAKTTDLVLYSSRTPQGTRDAVSGTVSLPKGKPPKGGWPVISWAHGTTGVADVCAPSRNSTSSPAQPYISYIYPDLNAWLQAGYAVVQTDYQGLGTPGKHPYLIGEAEGRSVLDIVSAARQLDPRVGKRFLIAGHSQGGQSALFAAGEASSWVPRLRLAGTVSFAPASHLLEQSALLPGLTVPSALTALATLILDGASTQSTAINPNALLSDAVLQFYPLLQSQCLAQLGASNELGGIAPSNLERSGADVSALNPVLAGMNPLVQSAAPILIEQGAADTTVFPFYTDQLNTELVNAGNQITYTKYQGIDHGGVVNAGEADALAFFQAHLPAH